MADIEFTSSRQCNEVPGKIRKKASGCADASMDKIFVFYDHVFRTSYLRSLDISDLCCHCAKTRPYGRVWNDKCLLDVDHELLIYVREINLILLHELLHIFSCSESEVRSIDRSLYPPWMCPLAYIREEGWEGMETKPPKISKVKMHNRSDILNDLRES